MQNRMGQQHDIVQHTENLQNIDRSELQGLFMQLMQMANTQLVQPTDDGQGGQGQLLQALNQQLQSMERTGGGKGQRQGQ